MVDTVESMLASAQYGGLWAFTEVMNGLKNMFSYTSPTPGDSPVTVLKGRTLVIPKTGVIFHDIRLDDPWLTLSKPTQKSVKRHFGPKIFFACGALKGASPWGTCARAGTMHPHPKNFQKSQNPPWMALPVAGAHCPIAISH